MLIDGSGDNGLAFVVDEATEKDSIDGAILRHWSLGNCALGKSEWLRTMRIALREHGSDPWNAKRVAEERDAVLGKLRERGIAAVLVMQTAALPGVRQVHSAWNLLGHPGNPYKWAGTVEPGEHFAVCPILNPFNYEFVYRWLIERWIRQAHQVAKGTLSPLPWPAAFIHPNFMMREVLEGFAASDRPLAIDIETNMAGTIVTAIGLSDGIESVSCPWHGYAVANREDVRERGLLTYTEGAAIERLICNILQNERIPKVLHNGAFDVVQLAKYGVSLAAYRFDTLLMHRVVYPQYRHGLQQACATEFAIEPYKTLFKPPKVSADKDAWLGDPIALRHYNAKDAYSTFCLAQSLAPKVGIDFHA